MVRIYWVWATTPPQTPGPLWLWQGICAYATSLLGKREYHLWFSFSVNPHKREDLVAFLVNRHSGKYLRSPCRRSGIPLIPWQSDQPVGWGLMHCLGGPYALPLSALSQQHVGTSCPGLLTGEELPTPTWGTHRGRA